MSVATQNLLTSNPLNRPLVICLRVTMLVTGCAGTDVVHSYGQNSQGIVFYLHGAGGGGKPGVWGRGVYDGLVKAGYTGDFHSYVWQTGVGVLADQLSSIDFKRAKAAELAQLIQDYVDTNPGLNVSVAALSAGTAVAVFALESLDPSYQVDQVVLLGSSLSSHYDLTKALRHVRQGMHVYTSHKDAVLSALVSVLGTADRQYCGACSAGLRGFHLPTDADPETRRLYAKVENINWVPLFIQAGNTGGHTDTVNPEFVEQFVAPLLMPEGPRFVEAGTDVRPK